LERAGLIAADVYSRKRVYTLIDNGKKTLEIVGRGNGDINGFVQNLISGNKTVD
jgi:DNA-binding PadR family transcriptional regulator